MTFVKGQKVSRAAVRFHPSFLFQRNDDEREFQSLFFKSVEQVVSVSLSLDRLRVVSARGDDYYSLFLSQLFNQVSLVSLSIRVKVKLQASSSFSHVAVYTLIYHCVSTTFSISLHTQIYI